MAQNCWTQGFGLRVEGFRLWILSILGLGLKCFRPYKPPVPRTVALDVSPQTSTARATLDETLRNAYGLWRGAGMHPQTVNPKP